jgi:hypothetical protein
MSVLKQQIDAVFITALKISDARQRSFFLDQACDGDGELRTAVDRLLAAQSDSDKLFDTQVFLRDVSAEDIRAAARENIFQEGGLADDRIGSRIGRYRLLERIGEGGCGAVYTGEQEEPVRRRVAIKVIKMGMDTKQVIARFEAERQALALMDHPNIARVLDAGAMETGRPYFVMELVRGIKITDYCDQNKLDTRQRLELFIQVCHAIQHAHQKGVIHRDIKPSNILVTPHNGVPMPKVIDFGIAKAIEGRLTEQTLFTACEQLIGTPAYMSPEQAEMGGLDVDTRSDIYSLGVLLYELLTGRTPFDGQKLMKGGLEKLRRTLCEEEPQRPSGILTTLHGTELKATASHRHAEPPKLISLLKGDLDWMVMKALEKDRTRRYETADGLAMDVQRFLSNEPIVARPPSRLYRFQKLVRRNRVVAVAATAVSLALLFGLGLSTWLFLQERTAWKRAVAAEEQQIQLREESERLRRQAEFREELSEAAVAGSRNQIGEADRLVAAIPDPDPHLEYAELYRLLADWHAVNGRWNAAAARCAVLVQVNQPVSWAETALDYLRYGSLSLEIGDQERYERFRQFVVARSIGTTNAMVADCAIRAGLLRPASADLLAAMEPLAATASNSLAASIPQSETWHRSLAAWRSFSLALLEYRRGNHAGMEHWREKSVELSTEATSRTVTFDILLAMEHCQTGQREQSRTELVRARRVIDAELSHRPIDGFWFDWLFAKDLADEADEMMQGQTGPGLDAKP